MRNVAAYAATLFFINPVEPVCLVLPVRVKMCIRDSNKGIEITPDDGETLWKAMNSNSQIVWQRSADRCV